MKTQQEIRAAAKLLEVFMVAATNSGDEDMYQNVRQMRGILCWVLGNGDRDAEPFTRMIQRGEEFANESGINRRIIGEG